MAVRILEVMDVAISASRLGSLLFITEDGAPIQSEMYRGAAQLMVFSRYRIRRRADRRDQWRKTKLHCCRSYFNLLGAYEPPSTHPNFAQRCLRCMRKARSLVIIDGGSDDE